MELLFLGRGNSSNYTEGNTAAYFIEGNQLFLIDCGETVFSKIMELNILKSIEDVNLLITHTHSDHIGSLGSLIMYCYFSINKRVHIILNDNCKHKDKILMLLESVGCSNNMYDILSTEQYENRFKSFQSIHYLETKHVDYLDCYGLLFNTENGVIYYSGDSRDIVNIEKILMDSRIKIDKIYVDVTDQDFRDNIHLYIGTLDEHIPKALRSRVYCMHFNNSNCIERARDLGFQIVEIKK